MFNSIPPSDSPEFMPFVLKHLGYDGFVQAGLSFLDVFGHPGSNASDTSATHDMEQVRGWNHAAILAKSLQFVLSSTHVFVSPEIADGIEQATGDETKASSVVTGMEHYDIPDDWVLAPRRHRIARLMRKPNPWTGQGPFMFQLSQHIESFGVCYLLVIPNSNRIPEQLYVVPKHLLQQNGPTQKYPAGSYVTGNLSRFHTTHRVQDTPKTYQQMLCKLSNRELSAEYVIPLGIPSLAFPDDFINPSSAMSDALDLDKEMNRARRNMMENQATAGPMLVEEPGIDLPPGVREQLEIELQQKIGGARNAGKAFWKPRGVSVEHQGFNGREMEYSKSAQLMREEILGQRLTPSALVGLGDNASYAGVVGVVKSWSRMSGQPMMRLVASQLTIGLQSFFGAAGSEFMVVMQAGNIDDPVTKQADLKMGIDAQVVRKGELREKLGMERFGDDRDEELAGPREAAMIHNMGGPGGGPGGLSGTATGPDRPEIGVDAAVSNKPTEAQKGAAYTGLSRREFTNSSKAIMDILQGLSDGRMQPQTASVLLSRFGLEDDEVEALVGSVGLEQQSQNQPEMKRMEMMEEPEDEESSSEVAKSVFQDIATLADPEEVWDDLIGMEDVDGDIGDEFIRPEEVMFEEEDEPEPVPVSGQLTLEGVEALLRGEVNA